MNSLILIAEVSFIIAVFSIINGITGLIFKRLVKVSWLKTGTEEIKSLRRHISRLLISICGVLCLLLVGGNIWLIYQGHNLQEYQLNLIRSIPTQFWLNIGIALLKSVSLLMVVVISIKPLEKGLNFACDRAKQFDQITTNDESIDKFFKFLKTSLNNGIWLLAFILCTQFLQLAQAVTQTLYVALKIYIIITIGLLILKATSAVIDSLDALRLKYSNSDNLLRFYDRLQHLIPILKKCLEFIIYVSMATLVFKEVQFIAWMADYGSQIIQIIAIYFISNVLIEVSSLAIEEVFLRHQNLTEIQRQRRLTIIPLIKSFLKYFIYFSAAIAVLKTLKIDPTPILAGAGIIGLAVGFGAQNLINDMVCGFFILFENYYLVGDFIEVKGASGFVEAIELRTTRIRNPNGQQYIIRNGEINSIVNYSKQYVYAVVDVGVSYSSNLDRVYGVIEEVGRQVKENYDQVLEPTQVDGVDKFGESEVVIRTITRVKPGTHNRIQRILRKLIKDAFDKEGIEIPFARRVLILKNESDDSSPPSKIEFP